MITAIDPGTTESAFVVFAHGEIIAKGDAVENHDLIEMIGDFRAHTVVCEMIASYGMAVGKETFETCRWIGRFEQATIGFGKEFATLFRSEVKLNLCKSMKAKDGNIRQALIDRYGKVGTKKNPGKLFGVSNHIWSALAVAVTYEDKIKPAFTVLENGVYVPCWYSTEPCESCFLPMATDGKKFWCSRGECKNESIQKTTTQ